jgi:hypothetical protein
MLSICATDREKVGFFSLWYKARLWNEAGQTVSVAESDRNFNKQLPEYLFKHAPLPSM